MKIYADAENLIQVVPSPSLAAPQRPVLHKMAANLAFHLRGKTGLFLKWMLIFSFLSMTCAIGAISAKEIINAIGPAGVIASLFVVGFLGAIVAQGVIDNLFEED